LRKKDRRQSSVFAKDIRVSLRSSYVPSISLTYHKGEFVSYITYVRRLHFEEEPDYNYLEDLFTQVLRNANEEDDGIFDWVKTKASDDVRH
jgi:hypothetical protein